MLGSRPLGWKRGWPLETRFSTNCVTVPNSVILGQTMHTRTEIRQKKNWPFASRLSRSFKVIGTDTDRSATCDFLLVIHRNHGPISYRFRDKRRFLSKYHKKNFPPRIFNAPLRECSPWNFVTAAGLEDVPTRRRKEFDDVWIRFDTIPAWRTDLL